MKIESFDLDWWSNISIVKIENCIVLYLRIVLIVTMVEESRKLRNASCLLGFSILTTKAC